jgi:hypothetical protein
MTYDGNAARPIRHGLTALQRQQLSELETVPNPTPYAKGRLNALRLCAGDAQDRARVEALERKWGEPQ